MRRKKNEQPPPTSVTDDVRRRQRWRLYPKRALPFLGYLAVQGFIVAGLPTPEFPDSFGYTQLSFTGNSQELPTVPLLYTAFPNDTLRICAQVLLAAIAWWVLAKVASDMVVDRRVRIGLRIVILMLGVLGPIAQWNSTIISESSTISLTALMVAAWMYHLKKQRWSTAFVGLVVTALWVFTRQEQVVDSIMIAAFGVVYALIKLRQMKRLVIAVLLVCITIGGVAVVGRNHRVSNGSLADIIADRILLNSNWTAWFVAQGMPYSAAIQQTAGSEFGDPLVAIPAYNDWLTAEGSRTYLLFILSHPNYTLWEPLASFSGEEASVDVQPNPLYPLVEPNPTPSMLSPDAHYGRHREVLPQVVQSLLFQEGQIGDVLALAGLAFATTWIAWRKRRTWDRRLWIPALVTLSIVPQGYLVWLGGGVGELDRISMILAVSVRIALWIIAGFSIDRILTGDGDRGLLSPQTATWVAGLPLP